MLHGKSDAHASAKLHRDETKFIEFHLQTEHKLEVWRRYLGAYLGIISSAGKRGRVDASKIFVVDVCSGAGGHLSLENPRRQVPGTAVQACIEARAIQRAFRQSEVRVRLVDIDGTACTRLTARVAEFQDAQVYPDKVDVRVFQDDFVNRIEPILREARKADGGRFCNLWLIDPYSVSGIPRAKLAPLLRGGHSTEIIVNLDVRAIQRMRSAIRSPRTNPKARSADRRVLNDLYGDSRWESAPSGSNEHEELFELARAYLDSMSPFFPYRYTCALRASDAQIRYLLHLTHARVAQTAFRKAYASTIREPRTSRALTITQRDRAAEWLFERFCGREIKLDEIVRLDEYPLDRGQVKAVLRRAQDTGYGHFDKHSEMMHWYSECRNQPALSLNYSDHTERKRGRTVSSSQLNFFDQLSRSIPTKTP